MKYFLKEEKKYSDVSCTLCRASSLQGCTLVDGAKDQLTDKSEFLDSKKRKDKRTNFYMERTLEKKENSRKKHKKAACKTAAFLWICKQVFPCFHCWSIPTPHKINLFGKGIKTTH